MFMPICNYINVELKWTIKRCLSIVTVKIFPGLILRKKAQKYLFYIAALNMQISDKQLFHIDKM